MSKYNFVVRFYRPTRMKFNAQGERPVSRDTQGGVNSQGTIPVKSRKRARRRSCQLGNDWTGSFALPGHSNEHRRRVVEIRIWDDENYPAE